MNVKVYLDIRSPKKNGLCPLKYVICHRGKSALLKSGIDIDAKRWDPVRLVVKSGTDKLCLNESIARRLSMVQAVVGKIISKASRDLEAREVKDKVVEVLGQGIEMEDRYLALLQLPGIDDEKKKEGYNFMEYYVKVMESKNETTRKIYKMMLDKMLRYDGKLPTYTFEDITPAWMDEYLKWVAIKAPAQNSLNNNVRTIKAVYHLAIRDGLTTHYPLADVRYKRAETEHRVLSVEDLRYIFSWDKGYYAKKWTDYFKLMFFLIGINSADIFNLKKTDVYDGRLHYDRAKTGRHYSIKLEPEAIEIIKRHKGKGEWLLDCHDRCSNHLNFRDQMNRALKRVGRKKVGGEGKYPFLSTYYTRHSWATIAHNELGIQLEDIAKALGHGKVTVTNVYIKPDNARVDAANRKVLDYVLYNKVE